MSPNSLKSTIWPIGKPNIDFLFSNAACAFGNDRSSVLKVCYGSICSVTTPFEDETPYDTAKDDQDDSDDDYNDDHFDHANDYKLDDDYLGKHSEKIDYNDFIKKTGYLKQLKSFSS